MNNIGDERTDELRRWSMENDSLIIDIYEKVIRKAWYESERKARLAVITELENKIKEEYKSIDTWRNKVVAKEPNGEQAIYCLGQTIAIVNILSLIRSMKEAANEDQRD